MTPNSMLRIILVNILFLNSVWTFQGCEQRNETLYCENASLDDIQQIQQNTNSSFDTLEIHSSNFSSITSSFFLQQSWDCLINVLITDNSIDTIDQLAFSNLTEVLIIDLSNNHFKYLQPHTFDSPTFFQLQKVEKLNLANNGLDALPQSLTNNLVNLRELYLGENNFIEIENNTIVNSPKLEILDFSHGNVQYIDSLAMPGSANVKQLILDNNGLTTIKGISFENFPLLEILILDNNELAEISLYSASRQLSIMELSLSNNKLNNPETLSLKGLPLLTTLNLRNNSMNEMDKNVLQYAVEEVHLDISYNDLQTLPITSTNFLHFKYISLNYNQFDCDDLQVYLNVFDKLDIIVNDAEICFDHDNINGIYCNNSTMFNEW